MRIGFIGTGKMATAIAKGILNRELVSPDNLKGVDISAPARQTFKEATGIQVATDPQDFLALVDTVVLAVKPQVAKEATAGIASRCSGKLIISIAAGLPLDKLCAWFQSTRVVRVMPNTPAMVDKGVTAFCCAEGIDDADRDTVRAIFQSVGEVSEVEEKDMDVVTALSGSGPAYIFEMIQAMTDAAEDCGLAHDTALQLAVQTTAGAAEMLSRGLGTPDQLRDAVTSPGGTTQAGLAVLSEHKFRDLIAATVRAARDRSIELGS